MTTAPPPAGESRHADTGEVPTANPGKVAVFGAPYTRHGHLIRGFSPEGHEAPRAVARCGGEAICGQCATDASRIRLREGIEQPMLGYATTQQLLDEIAARVEMSSGAPPVTKGHLMTAVGDLKEAIAKSAPALLSYRTAGA